RRRTGTAPSCRSSRASEPASRRTATPSSPTSATRTATWPAATRSTPASCRIPPTSSLDGRAAATQAAPAGGLEMETRDETLLRAGIAAALAAGSCDERERQPLDELARAAGVSTSAALARRAELPVDLPTRLGTPDARRAAYDLAVAVCHADGAAND